MPLLLMNAVGTEYRTC